MSVALSSVGGSKDWTLADGMVGNEMDVGGAGALFNRAAVEVLLDSWSKGEKDCIPQGEWAKKNAGRSTPPPTYTMRAIGSNSSEDKTLSRLMWGVLCLFKVSLLPSAYKKPVWRPWTPEVRKVESDISGTK